MQFRWETGHFARFIRTGGPKTAPRVAIELPTGDVFTSPELAGVGSADRDSKVDMKVTMIGVKVESLLVVMAKCLPTFR